MTQMGVAQKTGIPKWNPGKWTHGPKPAVCPSCLILSHSQIATGDPGGPNWRMGIGIGLLSRKALSLTVASRENLEFQATRIKVRLPRLQGPCVLGGDQDPIFNFYDSQRCLLRAKRDFQ